MSFGQQQGVRQARAVKHFRARDEKVSEIAAIIANPDFRDKPLELEEALRGIKPLRHRGHGRGTGISLRTHFIVRHKDGQLVAWPKDRNKYKKPHQGRQERLRRAIGGWGAVQAQGGPTKHEALASRPMQNISRVSDLLREEALA